MTLLSLNSALTEGPVDSKASQTHRGQASWAEGPKICSKCLEWNPRAQLSKGVKVGLCRKYKRLGGKGTAASTLVPWNAKSCRYFAAK